jgi:pyruvate/2-oxoglutarate/acetoin dehydrogenase E1 component
VEQGGLGAEIATQVQKEAFYYLDSPIVRVAAPFAPVPASPALEKSFVPGKTEIIRAVQRLMNRQTNL